MAEHEIGRGGMVCRKCGLSIREISLRRSKECDEGNSLPKDEDKDEDDERPPQVKEVVTTYGGGTIVGMTNFKSDKPKEDQFADHQTQCVRNDVMVCLSVLDHMLGHYCQTTHGSLGAHDPELSLDTVLDKIKTMCQKGSSYDISEASQCIAALLKKEKKGG